MYSLVYDSLSNKRWYWTTDGHFSLDREKRKRWDNPYSIDVQQLRADNPNAFGAKKLSRCLVVDDQETPVTCELDLGSELSAVFVIIAENQQGEHLLYSKGSAQKFVTLSDDHISYWQTADEINETLDRLLANDQFWEDHADIDKGTVRAINAGSLMVVSESMADCQIIVALDAIGRLTVFDWRQSQFMILRSRRQPLISLLWDDAKKAQTAVEDIRGKVNGDVIQIDTIKAVPIGKLVEFSDQLAEKRPKTLAPTSNSKMEITEATKLHVFPSLGTDKLDELKQAVDLIIGMVGNVDTLERALKVHDSQITQDYLHVIELMNPKDLDAEKLIENLHDERVKRRQIKQLLVIVKALSMCFDVDAYREMISHEPALGQRYIFRDQNTAATLLRLAKTTAKVEEAPF